jgi:hypothetical protein
MENSMIAPSRYEDVKSVSDVLNLPSKFYHVFSDLLFPAHGLSFLSSLDFKSGIKSKKRIQLADSREVVSILAHVAGRTIGNGKLFELIKVSEIRDGRPDQLIPKSTIGAYHLKRTLSFLSPPYSDCLMKFSLKGLQIPALSLNPVRLLAVISESWEEELLSYATKRHPKECRLPNRTLRERVRMKAILKLLSEYQRAFEFLARRHPPIKNLNGFKKELRDCLPSVAGRKRINREFEEACERVENPDDKEKKYSELMQDFSDTVNAHVRRSGEWRSFKPDDVFQYCRDSCARHDVRYAEPFKDDKNKRQGYHNAKTFLGWLREKDRDPRPMLDEVCRYWPRMEYSLKKVEGGKDIILPPSMSFMDFFRYRKEILIWIAEHRGEKPKYEVEIT